MSYTKWLQVDPKAEKYYSKSPYAYCLNNPGRFIDPDGKQIVGVTKNDAAKAVLDLKSIFKADIFTRFRNLIMQSGKNATGKSIANINNEALTSAFDGISLTEDQQALVDMAVNTINSSDRHSIEYVSNSGVISSQGENAFSGELSKAGLPSNALIRTSADITAGWVQGLIHNGITLYSPGGPANTGVAPVGVNSERGALIRAYPHLRRTLEGMPASTTLKQLPSVYYKK